MTRTPTARDLTLAQILERQQQAFLADPQPAAGIRRDRIQRLKRLVLDNAAEFNEAIREDYGCRPEAFSTITDIASSIPDLDHQRGHLTRWMKPTRVSRALDAAGFTQQVRHDPKGVVGIIGPWNFPLYLTIVPAGSALAAGNRVMIRPSSVTAHTTEVLCDRAPEYFAVDELAVAGPEHGRGSDFSGLPFDHLFFTGSPGVGRSVARDAADNLTPVTLELGGKNPVVVDASADLDRAARGIAASRIINGGQVCMCPDYVFVPEGDVGRFCDTVLDQWRRTLPAIVGNPEYTAIVNTSNYERVVGLIEDAVAKGAVRRDATPAGERLPDASVRKIAPTLLTGVTPEMEIDSDEVFGPVLTVFGYRGLDEAVRYINERPSPLVLYWYGEKNSRFDLVADRTRSGNIYGNDFGIGMASPAVPFGGVGNSGMGGYHGHYGFRTFRHERAVAMHSWNVNVSEFMTPPFTAAKKRLASGYLGALRARTRLGL
ncbi:MULTISPECIES: aldehyde dehydrogenase family protein [unclassified Dietzia]|uniref:aldehyde dehydrogenase family protein n=1 Tax=unclassified Dietzia TaxID=2617939 RepID=UPI000D20ACBF|nr:MULTISPECIES: aldehyde dehydrogenase family protein [unclassified Dietzia]AVZ38667.1 coniferyl aldehyde dehydrogenase [Dietzia sp. JS16-p6b]QGW23755.1 aldehyde dehydrogenase [Dietzia sp. DQ12-45-1b]